MKDIVEIIGFLLLVAAATTVGIGLALLVGGVGLIALANTPDRPERPKT